MDINVMAESVRHLATEVSQERQRREERRKEAE